jgi:hypothetical protein
MSDIVQEALQELFIALTTRWRMDNGVLAIGISKGKLLKAGNIQTAALDDLLQKLRARVSDLGLELVEYLYAGESWYALRSTYVCPNELTNEEEAVLGVVIANIETNNGKQVSLDNVKKKLLAGKYFSDYQLDQILKRLEQYGYLEKKQKMASYSPRTLLEFSADTRKHIAEQAQRLVF